MKKYFYSDDNKKHGPFSLDELKNEVIENDTLIWFEGLDDWTSARDLEEMKPILELIPPPISISFDKESHVVNTDEEPQEKESTESQSSQTVKSKQGMFSIPFLFDGRIRRTEYGISFIIYVVVAVFVNAIVESGETPIIGLAYIPMLWFLWAQGAKRCHDLGNNGWWQIIPFYGLWMLFQNGQPGINEYRINSKG